MRLYERPAKFALGLSKLGHEVHLLTTTENSQDGWSKYFKTIRIVSDQIDLDNAIKSFKFSTPIHHFSSGIDNYTVFLLNTNRKFVYDYKDIFPEILSLPSHGHNQVIQAVLSRGLPICYRDGQLSAFLERRNLLPQEQFFFIPDFVWPNIEARTESLGTPSDNRKRKLAFIGNFSLESIEPSHAGFGQLAIIRSLLSQNLQYFMYPYRHDFADLNRDLMVDYYKLQHENASFKLVGRKGLDVLYAELRQMGWGTHLAPACHFDSLSDSHYAIRPLVGRSTRLTDYLSVGLPIIASSEIIEASDWLRTYDIGLTVNRGELSDLSIIIESCDYAQLRRNVRTFACEVLHWRLWIDKVLSIYREHS